MGHLPEMKPFLILALASGLASLDGAAALAQQVPASSDNRQAQLTTDAALPQDEQRAAKLPPVPGRAGPYLAARAAAAANDFVPAARFFDQAVQQDPSDPYLRDGALVAMLSAGQIDDAVAMARQMMDGEGRTELAGLVTRIELARQGDWAGVLKMLDEMPSTPSGAGPLLDGMMKAWAQMGAGKASEAFATLEKLGTRRGAAGMARFQLALAKASVGDFEAAAKALDDTEASGHLAGLIAHVQVLSQLERRDEAIKLLDEVPQLQTEPRLAEMRAKLAVGETLPFDVIRTPADGIAQVLATFAGALMGGEDTDPLSLIYARLAQYLSPDMPEARLMVAQLLQGAGQFDLAEAEFEAIRASGDMRPVAELARIDALSRAGRSDAAEAAARALTDAWPDLAPAWMALGDLLRQQDKFGEAIPVYDKAVELLQKDADPEASWFALYARAISLERTRQFDRADADFQAALKLQPDQAPVLNYLGYSWVDRNVRLDEGLELIKKAVALRPDDGYILDSLAWAYYRLGRFAEAVEPMEKAVSAMSEDSLVNDHMGDIYWMVGRKREAEIQWRRAQSLYKPDDTDTDTTRIRAKLEVGLDAVLAAEKANGGKLPPGFGQPAETAAAEPAGDAPAATPGAPETEPVPPKP